MVDFRTGFLVVLSPDGSACSSYFSVPQLHGRSKCRVSDSAIVFAGHARSALSKPSFTFENQAIRVAIYVILSGVRVWLVARLKKFG